MGIDNILMRIKENLYGKLYIEQAPGKTFLTDVGLSSLCVGGSGQWRIYRTGNIYAVAEADFRGRPIFIANTRYRI